MKSFKALILIFASANILLISCVTSGVDRSTSNLDQLLIENPDLTLKDYLRRVSGIHVQERGGDVQVFLRGVSSVTGNNSPLFIVDGSQIGTSYSAVENAVDINDVASIRVMSSSEVMTMYGMAASNGAIIINTKGNR